MADGIPVKTIDATRILALAGDLVTVECQQAYPPGARVRLDLSPAESIDPVWVGGKITRVWTGTGGTFALCIRLHSLTAEQRNALLRSV